MKRISLVMLLSCILLLTGCTMGSNHMMDDENMMNDGMMMHSESSLDLEGDYPPSKDTQIINLNNGDSYPISAEIIEKNIGDHSYNMYGYNSMIPGPVLKVKKGSTIKVPFTNNINQETTIHWHGLRHDIKNDGVPGVSQDPVKPEESFDYTVSFPDSGIFWYHPHVREDVQQDLGLYGTIIVEDVNEQKEYNNEEVLVLDDILVSNNEIVRFGKEHANFATMGRFGNTMLINGKTNYKLEVNKGDIVRFYVANVANVRPYQLDFGGARMKLVGGDIGLYENEEFVESVIIAPAERYIIDVYFENSGEFKIRNNNPAKTTNLGKILVKPSSSTEDFSERFLSLKTNDKIVQDIDGYRDYFSLQPKYELELDIDMLAMMMGDIDHGMDSMPCHMMPDGTMMGDCDEEHMEHQTIEWEDDMGMMNSMSDTEVVNWIIRDKETGKENMDIMMGTKVGDKIKIRLVNKEDSMHPMQHPIHLHGQRFLVLDEDGKRNNNLVWKDTVLVPTGSTVDILVDVTNPGEWMMHCHIAEHLEAGMMASFNVEV